MQRIVAQRAVEPRRLGGAAELGGELAARREQAAVRPVELARHHAGNGREAAARLVRSLQCPAGTFTTLKVTGGSPGTGKVLTSDATGNATWQAAASGGPS